MGVRDSGIMGSDGFNYCIDSENLGLIDARIIDEELLSERILTLHAGILANKFTMFKLARVAQFGAEFSVFQDGTKINFGGIIFDLS